jgi:hypothetical protein
MEIAIDSLKDQLSNLESVVTTAMGLAFVAAFAGIQRSRTIIVFSVEMERKPAFWIVAAAFLLLNGSAVIFFFRIKDTLHQAGRDIDQALSTLALHAWVFNPFAFHGDGWLAQVYDGSGLFLLVVIWWLCAAALCMIHPRIRAKTIPWLYGTLLLVGLSCLGSIELALGEVSESVKLCPLPTLLLYQKSIEFRDWFGLAGAALGFITFTVLLRLRGSKDVTSDNFKGRA